VECDFKEVILQNDNDMDMDGIEVHCTRCGSIQIAFGREKKSFNYACRQLHNSCPKGENNYYVVPDLMNEEDQGVREC
jgi:hypothetical protein